MIDLRDAYASLDMAEKFVETGCCSTCSRSMARGRVGGDHPPAYGAARRDHPLSHGRRRRRPRPLLAYSEKTLAPKGRPIFSEGEDHSDLYLLIRGQVDLIRGQPPAFHQIVYPGAFFNEQVLYAPQLGTLTAAVATEDSLLLRVSSEQRLQMQHVDPHKAHQLVLAIFKQVEMREAFRRQHMFAHAGVAIKLPQKRRRLMSRALQRDLTCGAC